MKENKMSKTKQCKPIYVYSGEVVILTAKAGENLIDILEEFVNDQEGFLGCCGDEKEDKRIKVTIKQAEKISRIISRQIGGASCLS